MTPLDPAVLPSGIRARFVRDINGLDVHMLEAGFDRPGPAARCAAARVSGDRLFLAQGDAGARRCRVSCRRAGSARLWPDDRVERQLRRRSPAVPAAELRARRAGPGRRARLSRGRGGCRARFRRLGRGLVRAGAARRVPLAGADERAVRRAAGTAVRHRRRKPPACRRARRSTRRWRRCRGRASITNGTTRPGRPMRRCGIASRASTTSCAPISTTRAPTGRRTARIGSPPGAPRSWRRCRPITSWIWPTTCRRPSRRRCRPPPRSPPAAGCPTTSSRSMPANTSATASRAG